jgi:aminopeptidase N
MKLLFSLLLLGMCVLSAPAQIPKVEPGVSHELAVWRAARYSDVRYKLNLTLEKMSPVLKGTIEIRVNLTVIAETEPLPKLIILDWRKIAGHEKVSTISNVSLNGTSIVLNPDQGWPVHASGLGKNPRDYYEINEHLIFAEGVHYGENVIKLDFTSPILTSGSAITRYIDKEDGSEYIYSLLSPSNASTAFPMFNQPSLEATYDLEVDVQGAWKVVSNAVTMFSAAKIIGYSAHDEYNHPPIPADLYRYKFLPTKPISTDDFAFAAGPWQQMSLAIGNEDTTHWNDPNFYLNVYVRKSQPAKFRHHAAELFKTAREGNKYFTDKTAWPKYDLVLVPDLPSEMVQAAAITFVRESSIIGDK